MWRLPHGSPPIQSPTPPPPLHPTQLPTHVPSVIPSIKPNGLNAGDYTLEYTSMNKVTNWMYTGVDYIKSWFVATDVHHDQKLLMNTQRSSALRYNDQRPNAQGHPVPVRFKQLFGTHPSHGLISSSQSNVHSIGHQSLGSHVQPPQYHQVPHTSTSTSTGINDPSAYKSTPGSYSQYNIYVNDGHINMYGDNHHEQKPMSGSKLTHTQWWMIYALVLALIMLICYALYRIYKNYNDYRKSQSGTRWQYIKHIVKYAIIGKISECKSKLQNLWCFLKRKLGWKKNVLANAVQKLGSKNASISKDIHRVHEDHVPSLEFNERKPLASMDPHMESNATSFNLFYEHDENSNVSQDSTNTQFSLVDYFERTRSKRTREYYFAQVDDHGRLLIDVRNHHFSPRNFLRMCKNYIQLYWVGKNRKQNQLPNCSEHIRQHNQVDVDKKQSVDHSHYVVQQPKYTPHSRTIKQPLLDLNSIVSDTYTTSVITNDTLQLTSDHIKDNDNEILHPGLHQIHEECPLIKNMGPVCSFEHFSAHARPFDLICMRGRGKLSDLIANAQKAFKQGCGHVTHIGILVNTSVIRMSGMLDNHWYMIDSAVSSDEQVISVKTLLETLFFVPGGVQIRDLTTQLKKNQQKTTYMWCPLREHHHQTIAKNFNAEQIEEILMRHIGKRYTYNPLNFMNGIVDSTKTTFIKQFVEYFQGAQGTTFFCSELVATIFLDLNLIDKTNVDPRKTYPVDFFITHLDQLYEQFRVLNI